MEDKIPQKDSLTPEEEAFFVEVENEWAQMHNTPLNKEEAKRLVIQLSHAVDMPTPDVYFADSPKQAQKMAKEISGEDKKFNYTEFGSIDDYGWLCIYDFWNRLGYYQKDKLDIMVSLMRAGVGDMIFEDEENKFCIVIKCPEWHTDEENQLHRDGGPAVHWKGGQSQYYLHGTQVDQYLAETSASQLDIDYFNKCDSADVRTEFVRKFGIERLSHMGEVVDTYKNYPIPSTQEIVNYETGLALWEQEKLDGGEPDWPRPDAPKGYWYYSSKYELIDMRCLFEDAGIEYAPHLKMWHQTMGMFCVEPVHPDCKTIDDALKFRSGINPNEASIEAIK